MTGRHEDSRGVTIAAIARPKLADHVTAMIARDIVARRLSPADPLPSEPEIVSRFGVSKAVVRESIGMLVGAGVIRVQQGKRTTVLPEADWDMLSPVLQRAYRAEGRAMDLIGHLYEARLIIEPAAAFLCAQRSTQAQVAELDALISRMRTEAAERDVDGFLKVDRSFHDTIAATVGNPVVRAMMRDLHRHTASAWTGPRIDAADLDALTDQHASIADAVRDRDGRAAEDAMRAHVTLARDLEVARQNSGLTSSSAAIGYSSDE
jgi:DNA-binding FadR family transcriptional regulator